MPGARRNSAIHYEKVKQVYALREDGLSLKQIADATGVPRGTVQWWLKKPQTFDPYLDEIAIERALMGDRPVYDNLTIWERTEFLRRMLPLVNQWNKELDEWGDCHGSEGLRRFGPSLWGSLLLAVRRQEKEDAAARELAGKGA